MSTNIKNFKVRYQERIETLPGEYLMVHDHLIPLDEFVLTFMTPETVESLLSNSAGFPESSDRGWDDNGYCCVTGARLEHRVVGVICPGNVEETLKRLHHVPGDDELLELYKYETLPVTGV
jgi:hypothetical protein